MGLATLVHWVRCVRDTGPARALLRRLGQFLDGLSACFRRQAQRNAASHYLDGLFNDSERKAMQVRLDDRTAAVDGRRVDLTDTETAIVRYLAERLGQSVERSDLLRDLWGVPDAASTRTLDNHVARLRKKIERDPSRPEVIETVHGSGYRLRAVPGHGGER